MGPTGGLGASLIIAKHEQISPICDDNGFFRLQRGRVESCQPG
eukprot:SAG25_NODE_10236_length_341_cov_1.500000_1_plen_42_part_10